MHLLAYVVLALAAAPVRFDRPAFCPAEPAGYAVEKFDEVEFPTLKNERVAVSCLVYRDAVNIYVEVVVDNHSSHLLTLPAEPVTLEAGGVKLVRLPTLKSAEGIERNAVRPFTPAKQGAGYDRALIERQAKEHVERQEREALFAAFLIANAIEEAAREVPAGEHRPLTAVFRPPKPDKAAELRVTVRGEGDPVVFRFKPCAR